MPPVSEAPIGPPRAADPTSPFLATSLSSMGGRPDEGFPVARRGPTVAAMDASNPLATTASLSLRELVDSGSLAECAFALYKDEATTPRAGDGRRHLNAARAALHLAKAFASGHSARNGRLASVRLEDVRVRLSKSSSGGNGGPRDESMGRLSLEEREEGTNNGAKPAAEDGNGAGPAAIVGAKDWTVVGMEIASPPADAQDKPSAIDTEESSGDTVSALRRLGELIHAVFSQNKALPFATKGASGEGADISHSSKKKRSGASLFSDLVEAGDCPVSVSRLISDLIDGEADSPVRSFAEAIDDLEQMTQRPDVFLFDADRASRLAFGRGFYGQKTEIERLLSIAARLERRAQRDQAEFAFVTGAAGQGKTFLVARAGEVLSGLGRWTVVRTKFERGARHLSRQRLFALFDQLVSKLADMGSSSNASDVEFGICSARLIAETVGQSGLFTLSKFVPSISDLCPEAVPEPQALDVLDRTLGPAVDLYVWVRLLGKLMSAVFTAANGLDRFVLFCLDDMQWCDQKMLRLLSAAVTTAGRYRWRCLCVGTSRPDESWGSNGLDNHVLGLVRDDDANVTDIPLSSLESDAVLEMITVEMRLPRRLVRQLGDTVHKKTSGHALFVVQLLNSLVRDGIIAYSPRKLRYDYDRKRLASLQTWESVASLIVSNLKSLSEEDLQNLRILSCVGMECNQQVLDMIEGCPRVEMGGMSSTLTKLFNDGTLERDGDAVSFSHDIIQQSVYKNMTIRLRGQLLFDIGNYLGLKTGIFDTVHHFFPTADAEEQVRLSGAYQEDDTTLKAALVAVDMINKAGTNYTKDKLLLNRFATGNLRAAVESQAKSNFQSALHYCKQGIAFLLDNLWSNRSLDLCQKLHEGAAFASCAVGSYSEATRYANAVIDHVAFERSLFAQRMILRSLWSSGELQQSLDQGLALLRTLQFDLPSQDPSPETVAETLAKTEKLASQYSIDEIIDMQSSEAVDSTKRDTLDLLVALSLKCYYSASPYLPLVSCALVSYSLKNGIIEASAFALLAFFQVTFGGEYDSGRHWADVTESLLENSTKPNVQADLLVNGFVLLWYEPLEELADKLFRAYEVGLDVGDTDLAFGALVTHWRFSFYRGQNLRMLSLSYEKLMSSVVNERAHVAKYCALEIGLIWELMGRTDDPYAHFDIGVENDAALIEYAKANNERGLSPLVALKRFVSAFLFGDYEKADVLSKEAFAFPTSKMLKIQTIYHCFYHGLTSFYLYRGGKGDSHLEEGKKMLEKMTEWNEHSCTFENKLLLLEAEHLAGQGNRDEAIDKYETSARTARDNGFVHERGLAYEFKGHYLASIDDVQGSTDCYSEAYKCYMQWGACALAEKLKEKHNLSIVEGMEWNPLKHAREEA